MTPERRAQLAKGLANNALLSEVFEARASDIRDTWEAEDDPVKRERCWSDLKALNDFRDFLNARITEYRRGAD